MTVRRSQQIDAVFEFNDMLARLSIFNRSEVVIRVSCTSAEPGSVMSRKHGADDDIHAIRNLLEEFLRAWNACDAYAFANLYTDPHVDVNRTPAVETRTATVAALRKRLEHSAPRLSVTSDEVLVFGDWAVQWGEITLSGNGSTENLRYTEVLHSEKGWPMACAFGGSMRRLRATHDFISPFPLVKAARDRGGRI